MKRRAILVRFLQLCVVSLLEGAGRPFVARAGQTITIIAPTTAGSATDYATRVFSQELGRYLGETIVVVNMPANVAYEKVARAAPDGMTLTIYTASFQQYEARKSISIEQFAPVAVFAKGHGLLAPRNTPRAVIDRLEQATQWVTNTPSFRASLSRRQLEAYFVGSQNFLRDMRIWL